MNDKQPKTGDVVETCVWVLGFIALVLVTFILRK